MQRKQIRRYKYNQKKVGREFLSRVVLLNQKKRGNISFVLLTIFIPIRIINKEPTCIVYCNL